MIARTVCLHCAHDLTATVHCVVHCLCHCSWTSRRHDAVWVIGGPAHKISTFSSVADDLHTEEILSIVYPRDGSATWSTSIHNVG